MIHVAALLVALLVGVTAEIVGIARSKRGKVDTYTEMVAWLSERMGRWFLPVGFVLVGLLVWSIPHLLQAAGML